MKTQAKKHALRRETDGIRHRVVCSCGWISGWVFDPNGKWMHEVNHADRH